MSIICYDVAMILMESTDEFGLPILEEDFKSAVKKFVSQGFSKEEVDSYVSKFKKLKDLSRIPDAKQKDINFWAKGSFDAFTKFVSSLEAEKSLSQKKRESKTEGATIVAENSDWVVYRITTHSACMAYGAGTRWCVTSMDQSSFEKNVSGNDLYFIISKTRRKDHWNKIGVTVGRDGSVMYYDEFDDEYESLPQKLDVPDFPKKPKDLKSESDRGSTELDSLEEAKYKGKDVPLNKPMKGDVKKYKVYVKNPKTGNVKKVNFGDPNMKIKRDDPKRRKSFRARHKCDTAKDKTTARYWSCKFWSKKPVSKLLKGESVLDDIDVLMEQVRSFKKTE